jgi:3-methyladenine DNA glycosylase AlkD
MIMNQYNEIQCRLFALQDLSYKDFSSKLIPTADPDTVIGVRTPELRKLAKEYAFTPVSERFLAELPHRYFEENNLHGFLIEQIRDYDAAIDALEAFLPFIDNWATCDQTTPKVFQKNLPELFERIKIWLKSDKPYTVRYAIGMLMRFYLDGAFQPEIPALVAEIRSDMYYVNMMIAWYFATALCKRPEEAMKILKARRLDKWTHNKALQKAMESRRISPEQKAYLRSLKE